MSLFQSLFKETANHGVHKKHLKRISKICNRLGNAESAIPLMNYPDYGSETFKEDIEEVVRCMSNPCLTLKFLDFSHKSVEKIYKDFLEKEYNICLDWDEISSLLDEVDSIVLRMKYKHKRPRPKVFLKNISDRYDDVKESKSYSFPSGHTTIAYFLSGILSKYMPKAYDDLLTLAELIGQSRIENGVHFPTDVAYGKLVGEMLSDSYNKDSSLTCNFRLNSKSYKKCSKFLRSNIKKLKLDTNKYVSDMSNFIHETNKIEGYKLNPEECLSAANEFLMGYPVDYITDNPHIASTLNCIAKSFLLKPIDSASKVISIHKEFYPSVIERELPGSLRHYEHNSPTGCAYARPHEIHDFLKTSFNILNPYLKHIVYEWIHPFCDGNGRSGRILLLNDLGYDFSKVNQVMYDNYIQNLSDFMKNNNMRKIINDFKHSS